MHDIGVPRLLIYGVKRGTQNGKYGIRSRREAQGAIDWVLMYSRRSVSVFSVAAAALATSLVVSQMTRALQPSLDELVQTSGVGKHLSSV